MLFNMLPYVVVISESSHTTSTRCKNDDYHERRENKSHLKPHFNISKEQQEKSVITLNNYVTKTKTD